MYFIIHKVTLFDKKDLQFILLCLFKSMKSALNQKEDLFMVAGHLREQNGNYQMVLNWKGKDGKRKSKSISTGLPVKGNKAKAEEMLLDTRRQFNPANEPENADMLFADFIDKWMHDKSSFIPPALYAGYAYSLSASIQLYFLTNRIKLTVLAPNDLERFYCYEQEENGAGIKQLKLYHAIFTSALEYAIELKWLKENPATMVKPCAYETILFTDFLIDWLDVVRSKIAVTTYASYVSNVERSIIPFFDPKQLTLKQLEHRPQYIQEYYQHLLSEGLAPATVIRRHANVHSCLQYAFRLGLIKSNPADRVEKPSKNRFHTNIYNQRELQQLFTVSKDDPLELPILAAAFYGLRRSEIIGLRWSAIDFERKIICINHTVVQTTLNGCTKIIQKDETKTVSSYRTLPLVPPFEKLLCKVKETQIQNQQSLGRDYCKDYQDYICVDLTGRLLKPNFVTQHFSLMLERNGLKKIRFHDLRHSCASLLYASGIGLKEIQEWLGHSNIGTTSNIYTHLDYSSKVLSANTLLLTLL